MPIDGLILDVMACARLVKLARDDSITDKAREVIIEEAYVYRNDFRKPESVTWQEYAKLDRDPPALARLIECPWCLGIWMSGVVLILRSTRAGRPLRDLLAISWAASVAETIVTKEK